MPMISCANKDLDGYLEPLGKFIEYCRITALLPVIPLGIIHGLQTSRESFFSKIRNFLAWADKLGWNFMIHLGYFWPNYKHYIGTVSPLSIGKSSWIFFLQKTLVFVTNSWQFLTFPVISWQFLLLSVFALLFLGIFQRG